MGVNIIEGDCLTVLPTLEAESFHACVCDPPYHLTSVVKRFGAANAAPAQLGPDGAYARASRGFMGRKWDGGDVALRPETWGAVLRVLKPGAHLLAFGGTRTYHRLACAIEDAGFEIRDAIMWHYGQGFPKSHNVSKAIDWATGARETESIGYTDACGKLQMTGYVTEAARKWQGWGTALKPATEIIVVARKWPLIGPLAANLLRHECGALNIDGCRVEFASDEDKAAAAAAAVAQRLCHDEPGQVMKGLGKTGFTDPRGSVGPYLARIDGGRWPANVIHDGSDEVLAAFPQAPGQQRFVGEKHGDRDSVNCYGDYGPRPDTPPRGDSGSAARFFYQAKADKGDRLGSKHPTVKPVDLMRYLVRLVTPPGGHVLDPFAGSGTTGMAAMAEGFCATLIERETEYVEDIRRRLQHVDGADTPLFETIG